MGTDAFTRRLTTLALLAAGCASGQTSDSAAATGGAAASTGGIAATSGGSSSAVCVPGETRTCVGPGACPGGQMCQPSGAWSNCDCGSPAGGAATGGAAPAAGGIVATSGGTRGIVASPECSGLPLGASTNGGNCTGVAATLEQPRPLDVYIMQDRTQSMTNPTSTGTRWSDLANAVAAFLTDPEIQAQDTRVGIQFFSISGGFSNVQDCNPSLYAAPAVEIGPVATTGPTILSAIQNVVPSGQTPSVPALQGAIQHAIAWQAANPSRQTIVLFVTDGFPTMCEPLANADADLVAAVQTGMNNDPPIRTYVIGMAVGASFFRLRDIALYGGSHEPYLVEDTNARQALVDAFKNIARSPLPCEYPFPDPPGGLDQISYDRIQLVHTMASGTLEEVPYATSIDGCSQAYGGWYYDVPPEVGTPSKILFCPCSCGRLGTGTVELRFGCRPVMASSLP